MPGAEGERRGIGVFERGPVRWCGYSARTLGRFPRAEPARASAAVAVAVASRPGRQIGPKRGSSADMARGFCPRLWPIRVLDNAEQNRERMRVRGTRPHQWGRDMQAAVMRARLV